MHVIIAESCDGFKIILRKDEDEMSFNFDQEETKEGLVDMFKQLGIHAEYEEVY